MKAIACTGPGGVSTQNPPYGASPRPSCSPPVAYLTAVTRAGCHGHLATLRDRRKPAFRRRGRPLPAATPSAGATPGRRTIFVERVPGGAPATGSGQARVRRLAADLTQAPVTTCPGQQCSINGTGDACRSSAAHAPASAIETMTAAYLPYRVPGTIPHRFGPRESQRPGGWPNRGPAQGRHRTHLVSGMSGCQQ